MIFRKNENGSIETYSRDILENDNLVSVRKDVADHLWRDLRINLRSITFLHAGRILDINKPLMNIVGCLRDTIDCRLDDDIIHEETIVLSINVGVDRRSSMQIQVERDRNIDYLKHLLEEIYLTKVVTIVSGDVQLLEGGMSMNVLRDGETIDVTERNGEVLVNDILDSCQCIHFPFSFSDLVIYLKQRIAQKFKYDPDDFLLFFENDVLDEKKSIYEYSGIVNNSTLRYCLFKKIDEFDKSGIQTKSGLNSIVYKAKIKSTKEEIVIKQYYRKEHSQIHQCFKSLLRELVSFSRIEEHPRIVRFKGFFKDDSYFYIGMEYMKNGSIHAYIAMNHPLKEELIAKWCKQILEGLSYLHKKNIIHRDLKASNVLLDENFNVKISGLSSSKYFVGASPAEISQGSVQSRAGTYNYMAPEVIEATNSGSKSDIWSFGAICVEMVTGLPPYPEQKEHSVTLKIVEKGTIIFQFPSEFSEWLERFIKRCIQKNPNDRPTADELLRDPFLSPQEQILE